MRNYHIFWCFFLNIGLVFAMSTERNDILPPSHLTSKSLLAHNISPLLHERKILEEILKVSCIYRTDSFFCLCRFYNFSW